jgi:hypothetical protein
MFEIPPRDRVKGLVDAANSVAATTAVGFARSVDGDRVSVLYSYAHGLGEWVLPGAELPQVMLPTVAGLQHIDAAALQACRVRAAEAFLLDNGTSQAASLRVPGVEPATRLWIGLSEPDPLTPDQIGRFETIANDSASFLTSQPSREARFERLRRLEEAAGLLPALLHVLDVREVIDRLSATAKRALPHDLLILNLFSDDFSRFTIYARSDKGANPAVVLPNPYPASTVRAWEFAIIDDHARHPLERDTPATRMGGRSSLRFPVRFDDRVRGLALQTGGTARRAGETHRGAARADDQSRVAGRAARHAHRHGRTTRDLRPDFDDRAKGALARRNGRIGADA